MSQIFLNTNHKIRSIWWVPIFFILLALLVFPAILLSRQQSFELTIPIQAILIILVTIICQLLRKESITLITGQFNFNWIKQLITGLLIGAALMLLPALLLTLTRLVHWQVNVLSWPTILSGITLCAAVAIAEEFLFRGFLFQRLIESLGQWPAQLIIAGLFLLTHLNNPNMAGSIKLLASINIFLASMLFGLAYIKTNGLAMPIGMHFMANLVQGTILGFGVSGNAAAGVMQPQMGKAPVWLTGGNFGLEASIFGLLILIITCGFFYVWKPTTTIAEPVRV